jgi:hypothetical protein
MLGMAALANDLAKRLPEVTFIYRPHPFEKLETYHDLLQLSEYKNLQLVRRGSISDWLKLANVVIHRGCTTAIEAGLSGIPAFSPKWIVTPEEISTVESVSVPCATLQELEGKLRLIMLGDFKVPHDVTIALEQVIADWFHAVDGHSHQRVGDVILDELSDAYQPNQVDGTKCQKMYYGSWRGQDPPWYRWTYTIRKLLGLPAWWSLGKLGHSPDLAWKRSDRHFDADRVQEIVQAINRCQRNEVVPVMKVASAQENNEYQIHTRWGRTVVIRSYPECSQPDSMHKLLY